MRSSLVTFFVSFLIVFYAGAKADPQIPRGAWQRAIGDVPVSCQSNCPNRGIALGGFGAGSELSASGTFFANWRFHRRLSVDLGYRLLYLKFQDGADLKESTFHGPVFGLGIHF